MINVIGMRIIRLIFAASLVLFAGVVLAAPGDYWDAVTEFSETANPNGVWKYGSHTVGTPGVPVTPMPNSGQFIVASLGGWIDNTSISAGAIVHNRTGATVNYANIWTLDPDQLLMVSLPGEDSVLQFTAPSAGTYKFEASFTRLDNDGQGITSNTAAHVRYGSIDSPDDWSAELGPVHGETVSYTKETTLAAGASVYIVHGIIGSGWSAQHMGVRLSVLGPDATYLLGERAPRAGNVTITNVRSNKVRYVENDTATTKATLVNKATSTSTGTLIALLHLDLDTTREVGRTAFSIAAGETKFWDFSYNVGPETYGRSIEVRFVNSYGTLRDTWQEFYAVAAEFFRVHQQSYQGQMHTYKVDLWTTYFNHAHYFAGEPTDFGIQSFSAEEYISGQAGYRTNSANRQYQINAYRNAGVAATLYQTAAFGGQMGYEEARKHPEYALYDAKGRFSPVPMYGGYPNPMELASPIEVGPNRVVDKPYLDKTYHPWQHVMVNLTMVDAITYGANAIKAYASAHNFDGCYWDGTLGIWKGYNYDGTANVPSDAYADYVTLNARNHNLYSQLLKQDNSNFGTWFNWGLGGVDDYTLQGYKWYSGTGVSPGDPRDDTIRAATNWSNVMMLNEKQVLTGSPQATIDDLLRNRDKFVQELGANSVIGYVGFQVSPDGAGATKWAWPTVNYFFAQLIATQTHLASFFMPSYHPGLQFMTRYSRFIWAKDVTAVASTEAESILQVTSSEEVMWKKLVYRRNTADGYDLIVHLVRIPPGQAWDNNLATEPTALSGVTMAASLGTVQAVSVQSARPYQYGESQQPVHTVLTATIKSGKTTVQIPAFQYHTMVVFRVRTTP